MNKIFEKRDYIFGLLKEAQQSGLEGKIEELLKKGLGIESISKMSYVEDKNKKTVHYYFSIDLESANLYIELSYSNNTIDAYIKFDQRDKSQIKSSENNNMVIHPKPIPLLSNENIPELLVKLKGLLNTSIKSAIIDAL